MAWTLVMAIVVGTVSPDFRIMAIPMRDQQACERAKLAWAAGSSPQFVFTCMSNDTGEVQPGVQGQVKPRR